MRQMQFADRLRGKRCEKRMTQQQLARKLNVSTGTVVNWEINDSTPSVEKFKEICRILDEDPNYMLGWEER